MLLLLLFGVIDRCVDVTVACFIVVSSDVLVGVDVVDVVVAADVGDVVVVGGVVGADRFLCCCCC